MPSTGPQILFQAYVLLITYIFLSYNLLSIKNVKTFFWDSELLYDLQFV